MVYRLYVLYKQCACSSILCAYHYLEYRSGERTYDLHSYQLSVLNSKNSFCSNHFHISCHLWLLYIAQLN